MTTSASTTIQLRPFSLSGLFAPRKVNIESPEQEMLPVSRMALDDYSDARSQARLLEYQRAQRLRNFLMGLLRKGDLSQSTATAAWKTWTMLSDELSGSLIVPNGVATPDGQLLFTWDLNDHHFEVEVFPDRTGEIFYLNYRTNATWEYDYQVGDRLPDTIKDKLNLFVL